MHSWAQLHSCNSSASVTRCDRKGRSQTHRPTTIAHNRKKPSRIGVKVGTPVVVLWAPSACCAMCTLAVTYISMHIRTQTQNNKIKWGALFFSPLNLKRKECQIGGSILGEAFCVFTLKRLILYNYPIANINECAVDNGGCQDQCCNTIGSYFCRCQAGQKLEEDGRGCEGTSGDCLLTEKETEYLYNSKRGVAFHPSQLKHLC